MTVLLYHRLGSKVRIGLITTGTANLPAAVSMPV